ncbi:MAG: YeiH family protein, partial [Dehalococcoidia bacterium]
LDLPDAVFGVWAGIAVNDTSQVVAAGSAYSPEARDVATVVKLVRNALMAPLIVIIAWYWQRQQVATDETAVRRGVAGAVPLFVLGFLAMAALRTAGAITDEQAARLDQAATALILVALAGVGLNTRLAQMRTAGLTPFYVGLATASALAVATLLAILGLSLAPEI